MDREKAIKELEECIEHIRTNEFEKITFWGNCQIAMMDALGLLKEQEEREKAICKEICDLISGPCCTDTEADKDYVCHEIQKIFIRT